MSIDWKEYLIHQGADFQGQSLKGFTTLPESRQSNVLSVLDNRSFMIASGSDTQKFLQGQISVHMDQLQALQHKRGVACTPKGRMYSSFHLLNTGSKHIFSMDTSILEHTLTTLGKYAVFFKSDLERTDDIIALGLSGEHCASVLQQLAITPPNDYQAVSIDGGHLLKIPGRLPRFELWIKPTSLPHWWEKLTPFCAPASSDHWSLLDIESVQPIVTEKILEKYIPQHLNMPTLGGVSFRKGCFTGQEIITRMQSLGQQKSRTYHLQISGQHNLPCGDKVYNNNGKTIGEVLASVYDTKEKMTELLAVIRIETAQQGTVYLDDQQQAPAKVLPLPYTVDTKAELQQ